MSDELDRLQKELYAKGEPPELVLRRKKLTSLTPHVREGAGSPSSQPSLVNVAQAQARRRRARLRWLAGAIAFLVLFVAAVVGTMVWRASRQVKDADIGLAVQGPADVTAGDEVKYTITFQNNSRVAWQNVEVAVSLPAGFRPHEGEPQRESTRQIGGLAAGQASEFVVEGRLIGEEGTVAVVQAELTLTPENFPSGRFTKTAVGTSRIAAMPIDISIEAPAQAGSGERVRGVIHVRNAASVPLANAVLQLQPVPGVELATEDAEFSAGFQVASGEWALENIGSLSEVTRTFVFFVQGSVGERRLITARVGVRDAEQTFIQREVTQAVLVSASELEIEQAYNGTNEPLTVFPADTVQAEIQYKNTGTAGLRNVAITIQFQGSGFDARTLNLRQGAYNPTANTITWTAASVPGLALLQPGEEGKLTFEFDILPSNDFPTTEENFALVSMATIDSQDLPTPPGQEKKVISDRLVMSVGSVLQLEPTALYDDGRLGIKSSGPLPPRVNQTTTYTVRLRLGSALNDVGEAEVVATLPDGVTYTNKTVVSKGTVQFDDRSRQVLWTIPLLEGGVGRARPAEELYFQVSITPGANLVDRVLPLLGKLTTEGTDIFIDQLITANVTELPTTQTASAGRGQVEP